MRSTTLFAAAALLLSPAMGIADTGPGARLVLAQAMTGGAGSNSAAGAGSPKTEAAPGTTDGKPSRPTSKDFGSGQPLAGDEQDQRRPNADSHADHEASGHGAMPQPTPPGTK